MAHSDNYPNGYKDGYDSWDDPDRKNYSPYAVEMARRNAYDSSSHESKMSAVDEYRKKRYEAELRQEQEARAEANKRAAQQAFIDKKIAVIHYKADEKREALRNRGLLKKAVAAISGKGYWKEVGKVWDQAVAETDTMSDKEIESFYRTHVR